MIADSRETMRIVAFVGADGTGKTTQAKMLLDRLASKGHRARYARPVFSLFDPWRMGVGGGREFSVSPRVLRVRSRTGRKPFRRFLWSAAGMLLGYFFSLATYGVLRLRFRKEQFVVCDRFFYQYFYDLYGRGASNLAKCFPRPDLVFWLDGTVPLIRSRTDDPLLFEDGGTYLDSVIEMYGRLSGELGFRRIRADLDPAAVRDAVWEDVTRAFWREGR
jgi:thymidylate kinase